MHHRERKKMSYILIFTIIYILNPVLSKTIVTTENTAATVEDNLDNNIINFEEDFSAKYNNKYGAVPWHSTEKLNKNALKYTVIKNNEDDRDTVKKKKDNQKHNDTSFKIHDKLSKIVVETTPVIDYGVIPLELISTTENILVRILDSTTEPDLTVIPLSTTKKTSQIEIKQTVTLPVSTHSTDITTEYTTSTENEHEFTAVIENHETTTSKREANTEIVVDSPKVVQSIPKMDDTDSQKFLHSVPKANDTHSQKFVPSVPKANGTNNDTNKIEVTTEGLVDNSKNAVTLQNINSTTATTIGSLSTLDVTTPKNSKNISSNINISKSNFTTLTGDYKSNKTENVTEKIEQNINNDTKLQEDLKTNSSKQINNVKDNSENFDSAEFLEDVPVFTELDIEEEDVPEDYYDAKDVLPTTVPKTDALSVIFGLAGSMVESVVESVAERVVPKGLYDLFKRMQRQNEALEAERLRSREENGGIGQFTRGIIKSLSTGLSKPLSQLMAGVKDIGSLDTDRGFVSSLASGVTSVATSVASAADAFKDKVQAIYPGTVWCGDGRSATARSSDLGLFFFTDTCCRQHDACKIFIKAGDTKYGLTNTGLFTRSHCSCDTKFRECLHRTNSLVSAQIGLTYFNVLGPQCFRKAHPIVKCVRRTRITGQKCEEYELDYTKPKMWQWFDNETF